MKYFGKISSLLLLLFVFVSMNTQTVFAKTAAECAAEGKPVGHALHAACINESSTNSDGNIQFAPPVGVISNIPALITFAIQILFVVAGLVAFVYLLLGGIKWITSGGDKGQVEAARNQIIQALIGLVVVFAAWGMIVLLEQLLNIPLGFSKPFVAPSSSDLNTIPSF